MTKYLIRFQYKRGNVWTSWREWHAGETYDDIEIAKRALQDAVEYHSNGGIIGKATAVYELVKIETSVIDRETVNIERS